MGENCPVRHQVDDIAVNVMDAEKLKGLACRRAGPLESGRVVCCYDDFIAVVAIILAGLSLYRERPRQQGRQPDRFIRHGNLLVLTPPS
jgi:hypothetical protein